MTRIIGRTDIEKLYDDRECIKAMAEVQKMVSDGLCSQLDRGLIPFSNGNTLAVMPGGIECKSITGSKLAIFAGPETKKKQTQQGIIPLFCTDTGQLIAVVEAELVTVLRTAAVSAMATECLSRKDAFVLGVIGTGRLAYLHIRFISQVRDIREVYLYSQESENAHLLAERIERELGIKAAVCSAAEEVVCSAHILCTVTNSREPVLSGDWVRPGTHINAVGACKSTAREMDAGTVNKCSVFVDSRQAAMKDAGDLLIPMGLGEVREDIIAGEIGEVLQAGIPGRQSEAECTLFESVGLPPQDLMLAHWFYRKACERGMGTELELS